jgi:oxygen-independent coproporphyrinogen III oxidase
MFLGLRLNRGVDLNTVEPASRERLDPPIRELSELGLVEQSGSFLRLTSRGRLLSNEVFERFISSEESVAENRKCFVE